MDKNRPGSLLIRSAAVIGLCLASFGAHAGVRDGGGGSLVSADGKLEPADLHYNGHAEVIPSTYVPIKFADYPKAVEALQFAITFLKERAVNDHQQLFTDWDIDDTEFYFVPRLSGEDLLPVESDLGEIQVAFTRDIVDPDNDPAIRPVVEIMKGPFDLLSPEYQGLVLLHELMHHKPYGQHTVISPIIKSLNVLLPLKQLQNKGNRSALTDQQLLESRTLERLMSIFEHAPPMTVVRNGGGLLDGAETGGDGTFIGLSSSLRNVFGAGASTLGNTLIDSHVEINGCGDFRENEFINSKVTAKCSALWANHPGAYQADRIMNNRFKNSTVNMDFIFFVGDFSANTFEDVTCGLRTSLDIKPRTPVTISDNILRSITSSREISLNGSANSLTQIRQEMGRMSPDLMTINGDGNRLENIRIKMDAARIALGSKDTLVDFEDSAAGVLTLRDSVQIQSSAYENGESSLDCDTVLPAGAKIQNQPTKCTLSKKEQGY